MRIFSMLLGLTAAIVLSACAAPASQFYTLAPSGNQAAAVVTKPAPFAISVSAIEMPQQLDRPQIVLRQKGSTQVTLLNESLWAAPLSNEIHNALANRVSNKLGTVAIMLSAVPRNMPLWVISVLVQRFESVYGEYALIEATWKQEPRHELKGKVAVCRAVVEVPVKPGIQELVAGHQQALQTLADLMVDELLGRPLVASAGVNLKGCR